MTQKTKAIELADQYNYSMRHDDLHLWAVEATKQHPAAARAAPAPAVPQGEPVEPTDDEIRRAVNLPFVEDESGTEWVMLTPKMLARAVRRMLAATPAAPSQETAVPEGWKLVPVEPTDEMYEAGYNKLRDIHSGPFNGSPSLGHSGVVYRAMLAASPAQPATEQACQTKGDCKRYGCNGACSSATEHLDSPVYTWESRDGKQHDTGRVMRGGKSFFADTASPQDARLIAEALNAYVAAKPDAQSVVWIATRLWNARELWTCPADIERMLAATPATPSQPVTLTDDEAMAIYASTMLSLLDETEGVIGGPDVVALEMPTRFARAIIAAMREKEGK